MEEKNNYVELIGTLSGKPEFSHMGRNEIYYSFPLDIERLSGAYDMINIVIKKEILENTEIEEKQHIKVIGELRSYNNKSGKGNKLLITVMAKKLEFTDEEDKNIVELHGTLCKTPNLRKTPMGREICDLMLAVNRRYRRSDYLPCIAWGKLALNISECDIGSAVFLSGRIQSRKYIKIEDEVSVEKTAFEVSAIDISCIKSEQL